MNKEAEKINQLYIKGRIDKEEYSRLISKYDAKTEPTEPLPPKEKIQELISNMSLEDLLDTYRKTKEDAASKVMQPLIIAELENRIG